MLTYRVQSLTLMHNTDDGIYRRGEGNMFVVYMRRLDNSLRISGGFVLWDFVLVHDSRHYLVCASTCAGLSFRVAVELITMIRPGLRLQDTTRIYERVDRDDKYDSPLLICAGPLTARTEFLLCGCVFQSPR